MEECVGLLERHALDNPGTIYTLSFAEGDEYECEWENGEYVDNDEETDSPEYEEWYELDFKVLEVRKAGPNKDPRYNFIQVSRKHMPARVVAGDGAVVFGAAASSAMHEE